MKTHPNHYSMNHVRKLTKRYERAATVAQETGCEMVRKHAERVARELRELCRYHFKRVPIAEVEAAINQGGDLV